MRHRFVGGLLAAALLTPGLGACTSDDPSEPAEPRIRVGTDEPIWPARGDLADDDAARRAVGGAVSTWRSPDGARADLARSSALWLGTVGDTAVAVVDVRLAEPGRGSWVVEVTGRQGRMRVAQARDYPDRNPVVLDDVVAIRSPGLGPRYLASRRVRSVAGQAVTADEAVTDRVGLTECAVTAVVAERDDGERSRYLDLGPGGPDRAYPLLQDGSTAGAATILAGVDTCAADRDGGWLSAVREALGNDPPTNLGTSPTLTGISSGGLRGTLTAVQMWGGQAGDATVVESVLWRPSGGQPVLSTVRPGSAPAPLVFKLATAPRPMAVVTYPVGPTVAPRFRISDARLAAPATTLVSQPGLLVALLAVGRPVVLSYRQGGAPKSLEVTA